MRTNWPIIRNIFLQWNFATASFKLSWTRSKIKRYTISHHYIQSWPQVEILNRIYIVLNGNPMRLNTLEWNQSTVGLFLNYQPMAKCAESAFWQAIHRVRIGVLALFICYTRNYILILTNIAHGYMENRSFNELSCVSVCIFNFKISERNIGRLNTAEYNHRVTNAPILIWAYFYKYHVQTHFSK